MEKLSVIKKPENMTKIKEQLAEKIKNMSIAAVSLNGYIEDLVSKGELQFADRNMALYNVERVKKGLSTAENDLRYFSGITPKIVFEVMIILKVCDMVIKDTFKLLGRATE
jgi:hypothetical protein